MQVSDFKVDFRLKKNSKAFAWNSWNVLTRMRRKKGHFVNIRGGDAKIATDTKSLDSRYAYHVSNGDVREPISKVGSAMRLCFSRRVY